MNRKTVNLYSNNNLLNRILHTTVFVIFLVILNSCEKVTTDDEIYGNWARRSEYEGVGRTEAVSFTIGDFVYVGSGFDGRYRLNDFWKFDQVMSTWIRIADFPGTARSSAIAFTINGKAYFGTGYDDNGNYLKDIWEYNPVSNSWTRKADFGGTARFNATAFAIGNYGYVTTGYDGNYLKDNWRYDAANDKWDQVASLTGSKRTEAVSFVYNGQAYVLTGQNNGSYLNDFWVYDPETNTWAEKRKINAVNDDESYDDDYGEYIKRSNAAIFLMNNKAYLVAGNISSATNTTWEYDIANDLWTQKTSLEGNVREGHIGFNIANRGYIVTGHNSAYRFDDLWEFFPNDEQSDNDN